MKWMVKAEHLRCVAGVDGCEGAAQAQLVAQQCGDGVGVAVAADKAQQANIIQGLPKASPVRVARTHQVSANSSG